MGYGGQSLIPTRLCLGSLVHTLEEHLTLGGCLMSQKLPGFMTRPDGQTMK